MPLSTKHNCAHNKSMTISSGANTIAIRYAVVSREAAFRYWLIASNYIKEDK